MWGGPDLKEWQNLVTVYLAGLHFLGLLRKTRFEGFPSYFFSFCLLSAQFVFLQKLKMVYEKILRSLQICDPEPDI